MGDKSHADEPRLKPISLTPDRPDATSTTQTTTPQENPLLHQRVPLNYVPANPPWLSWYSTQQQVFNPFMLHSSPFFPSQPFPCLQFDNISGRQSIVYNGFPYGGDNMANSMNIMPSFLQSNSTTMSTPIVGTDASLPTPTVSYIPSNGFPFRYMPVAYTTDAAIQMPSTNSGSGPSFDDTASSTLNAASTVSAASDNQYSQIGLDVDHPSSPHMPVVHDAGGPTDSKPMHKRFHCSYEGCSYSTHNSSNLKSHSRRHTGIKPYVCNYDGCTYKSSQRSNIKNHLRIHQGVKPYTCLEPNCKYASTQRSNLVKHQRRIHGGSYELSTGDESKQYDSSTSTTAKEDVELREDMEDSCGSSVIQHPTGTDKRDI